MMENLLQGTDEKEIDLVKNDISSIQKDFNKINQKKFEKIMTKMAILNLFLFLLILGQ